MSITLPAGRPAADAAEAVMVVRYRQSDFRAIFQRVHVSSSIAADVVAEFGRYAAIVRAFYDDTWNIDLTALWSIITGTPTRVACPEATTVPGTNLTATTGISGVAQKNFMFYTGVTGHHSRLRFEAVGGLIIGTDEKVTSSTGGDSADQALVGYVTGGTTLIRARDGTHLLSPAHLTYDTVKRDRAKGMRVA